MRILLCVDVPNWAWDIKAKAIKKYLADDHQIEIIYQYQFNSYRNRFKNYDVVFSFCWITGLCIARTTISNISSYNYEWKHFDKAKSELHKYKAIVTVSKLLYDRVRKQKLNNNVYCTPNGVDHNLFIPRKKDRDKRFKIGWVGQPTRGNLLKDGTPIDMHGCDHILKPLDEKLKKYKNIRLMKIMRHYKNALTLDEMVKFYNTVDCQIHTGFLFGTPNPIFEAASCGKALICTNQGAASEMIENNKNGYIVDSYMTKQKANEVVDQFVEKILFLEKNRDLCEVMGEQSRKIIEENWTWKERVKQYNKVFEENKE